MAEEKSFEQALQELEQITKKLEDGNTPLDTALALFESGVALSKELNQMLDAAQQRIRVLTEQPDGSVREQEIDAEQLKGAGTAE